MISILLNFVRRARGVWQRYKYPHISKTSRVGRNVAVFNRHNLYMEENTNINPDSVIMNSRCKFIMKKNSGAANALFVSTGNHMSIPGMLMKQVTEKVKDQYDTHHQFNKDVVVEEDVWIASRVTLLAGVKVGRGSVIGAGAVVRKNIPPYSIVIGNPSKIVGFRFTPEEALEHEAALYPESERIPSYVFDANYSKYYLDRIKEVKSFLKQ